MTSLTFEERSYGGKNFRPTPEVHLDSQAGLLIVATPWGPRAGARTVIERMTDYLRLARDDGEATSPFSRLSCVSTQANHLRTAALLANEALFRGENREEYKTGVELFAGLVHDDEFVWLQAGNPQVLLCRDGWTPLPLGSQMDLAYDLSPDEDRLLPPLPAQLLGLHSTVNIHLNGFKPRSNDRLVLISHSHLPGPLFTRAATDLPLDDLAKALAGIHPGPPFWLGILEIGGGRG